MLPESHSSCWLYPDESGRTAGELALLPNPAMTEMLLEDCRESAGGRCLGDRGLLWNAGGLCVRMSDD